MIRVLHYIGALELGGSQSFVMEIYRNIDREKVQFDFIAFPDAQGCLYDEINSLGGKVFESPKYNGINHKQFTGWWNRFLDEHPEYSILHGHVRSVSSIYLPIAKRHGMITVMHSHSTSNGSTIDAKIKDIMQYPARFQADYLFACSHEAGKWLFGKSVGKRANYKIIRNAINARKFAFDCEIRARMRKKLGISDGTYVVGHLGRMVPPKNHRFLIDVFEKVQIQVADSKLLLVGDGYLRGEIESRIKEKGLGKKCILTGFQSNTQDYYQVMDVFLFPSLWEGFGISLIEAQASGLPCIISEVVPRDVDIGANLVSFLSLKEDSDEWVKKAIEAGKRKRIDRSMQVKAAGYDIEENVRLLQNFYLEKVRGIGY